MYPSLRPAAVIGAPDAPVETDSGGGPKNPRVSANVIFLGLTSLFTDVSSEMITAILPIYLLFQLRFSYLQFGLFNGLYIGITGLMTVVGAIITDRFGKYKEVAGRGYGTSAACKLGSARGHATPPGPHRSSWPPIGSGRACAPRPAIRSYR